MAIDVGAPATDRASDLGTGYTWVLKDNPANASGIINTVEIWAETEMTGCKVATFYRPDPGGFPDNLTARDVVTLGNVTAGSKQTFSSLSLDVEADDYIGLVFSTGAIERDSAGGLGVWHLAGDQTACENEEFDPRSGRIASLYGTGVEPGWTGKIMGVTNPAKIMGIDVANIAKVNGVS